MSRSVVGVLSLLSLLYSGWTSAADAPLPLPALRFGGNRYGKDDIAETCPTIACAQQRSGNAFLNT